MRGGLWYLDGSLSEQLTGNRQMSKWFWHWEFADFLRQIICYDGVRFEWIGVCVCECVYICVCVFMCSICMHTCCQYYTWIYQNKSNAIYFYLNSMTVNFFLRHNTLHQQWSGNAHWNRFWKLGWTCTTNCYIACSSNSTPSLTPSQVSWTKESQCKGFFS